MKCSLEKKDSGFIVLDPFRTILDVSDVTILSTIQIYTVYTEWPMNSILFVEGTIQSTTPTALEKSRQLQK